MTINKKLFTLLCLAAFALSSAHSVDQVMKESRQHVKNMLKIHVPAKKNVSNVERSFTIDYDRDTFLMDGEPFRYVAGSFHYFRTLPSKWLTIMQTMRAGGLNAVDIYVHWGLHNPREGEYNWEGIADLEKVLKAAEEAGLYVILRPGPYICAELDNGGHPYWLYRKFPGIQVRTKDMHYLMEVSQWWTVLFGKVQKYLYGNGGPIILVQVENEYGAYKEFAKCDAVYKKWLAAETHKYTEDKAVLFTVDRPFDGELECGLIENVLATCDFGLQSDEEVDAYWAELRKVQPKGPLVNSELYTGWLTHWHEKNQRRPAAPLAATLNKMLGDGANVNFYMYFGGTNFGFSAGANDWGIGKYQADITSYDYDAPLDEAGNPSHKFKAFKEVIQRHFPEAVFPDPPTPRTTYRVPDISLAPRVNLLEKSTLTALGAKASEHERTATFEELDQDSGFVLYETRLPKLTRDPSELKVEGLRDRAWVFIDNYYAGTLSRENNIDSLPISAGWGDRLQILVENQGRINFQADSDFKGIIGNVLLQDYEQPYVPLRNWTATGIPLDNYAAIETLTTTDRTVHLNDHGILTNGPVVFAGEFDLPFIPPFPFDMYLDLFHWGKGVVFINGFNLGRYWPLAGPQVTTYIPGELLHKEGNKIVLIEFQRFNRNECKVSFAPGPRLDE